MVDYFIPLLVSTFLVAACLYLHFKVLRLCARKISKIEDNFRYPILVIMSVIFATHLLEILFFAMAFWAMAVAGIGNLTGTHSSSAADYFYYSSATYTTLGIGDISPEGSMRLVSGIEALTGLLLIAWSASFTYLIMEEIWSPQDK